MAREFHPFRVQPGRTGYRSDNPAFLDLRIRHPLWWERCPPGWFLLGGVIGCWAVIGAGIWFIRWFL